MSPNGKIRETISPCRYGLLPHVSLKKILKIDFPNFSNPPKIIFWSIVSQEEFKAS
jgi:hypothetical protein